MEHKSHPSERREFLKNLGLAATAALIGGSGAGAMAQAVAEKAPMTPTLGQIPQRKFGRHDLTVSALALGGYTLATAKDEKESFRIMDEAIAAGLTFMDNCWDYHDGRAEDLMGRALVGKRDQVFLMTKLCTHGKGGKKEVMKYLEQSLTRLKTDHLDLWQLHAVATMDQVPHAFDNGILEAMLDAKKQGKTRFLGFTGHTNPDVHLAVLAHQFPFDSCQLPISPIEANSNAFVRRVLPELVKQKIAPLAMKTLGGNAKAIQDNVLTVDEALRYAFSQPVATIVTGVNSLAHLRQNIAIARAFVPMPSDQMLALEARCQAATESNKYQPYREWLTYRDGDSRFYV